jgi:hypothetical protein
MAVVRHFALKLVRQSSRSGQSSTAASAPPGTRNTCWTLSARCIPLRPDWRTPRGAS